MKWFGWKSGRDAARPVLSRYASAMIGDWPPSYERQVREGYLGNAIAQRAVKLVTEGIAGAPLTASDPAILQLIAARSSGQALVETVAAHLLLHGNAYVQLGTDPAGGLAELFALRPERVSVEADAGGWPAAYRYRVGERVTRLSPDGPRPDVVHLKLFHPLDDHHGAGCLGAASEAVAVHNASARWNRALLDNAARPSGALVYDPGDGTSLSPEQFERLRAEMEAGFAGAANAGRPMLLEGGLKWQALSLTPADLDFAETRSAAAREIALAFGVPPMLLGLPGDATYANYKEANRSLWRLTILPLADMIFTGLGQAMSGWFDGATIAVDLNRVPALADDRATLWAQLEGAGFLSRSEKRALAGLS